MIIKVTEEIKYTLMGLVKSILVPLTKNHVYIVNFAGMNINIKGGFGFQRFYQRFSEEERLLAKLDLSGKTIYDIGSCIGILTVFFAKSSGKNGKVIAFEPNFESYMRIKTNIEINGFDNIQILNIGIGRKDGVKTLIVPAFSPATGSMEKNIQSNFLKQKGFRKMEVEVYSLDNCVIQNKLPKPDFIKIDVEGMEYDVLLGMTGTISEHKPSLWIEVHDVNKKGKDGKIQSIVRFIDSCGYTVYHVESRKKINKSAAEIYGKGHLFCYPQNQLVDYLKN